MIGRIFPWPLLDPIPVWAIRYRRLETDLSLKCPRIVNVGFYCRLSLLGFSPCTFKIFRTHFTLIDSQLGLGCKFRRKRLSAISIKIRKPPVYFRRINPLLHLSCFIIPGLILPADFLLYRRLTSLPAHPLRLNLQPLVTLLLLHVVDLVQCQVVLVPDTDAIHRKALLSLVTLGLHLVLDHQLLHGTRLAKLAVPYVKRHLVAKLLLLHGHLPLSHQAGFFLLTTAISILLLACTIGQITQLC